MNPIEDILRKNYAAGEPISSELLPLLYDELRNLAAGYMSQQAPGQTLQPTALVHEAWLRLSKEESQVWSDRVHFFRAAAQAMRQILVDRARSKSRLKRGANALVFNLDDFDPAATTTDDRILLIDEMLDRLERENPESARVISLKFFGGLTEVEIASMDGVAERTIRRRWAYAKTRLVEMLNEQRE